MSKEEPKNLLQQMAESIRKRLDDSGWIRQPSKPDSDTETITVTFPRRRPKSTEPPKE